MKKARQLLRSSIERLRNHVYRNVTLVGLLSLAWLIIRSGRKPTRLRYPCQRAALANSTLLLAGVTVPLAARLPRLWGRGVESVRFRRFMRFAEVSGYFALAALVTVAVIGLGNVGYGIPGGRSLEEMSAAAEGLSLPRLRSGVLGSSDIYVAENIPAASEAGVDTLIDIMDANGLDFFKSASYGKAAGPNGIIGSSDVVMIKVNGEWQDRGGTNTDVIKGLVGAIVRHPDGFTGEVAIVENGQWASFMDNRPDNRNPDRCNAEDRTQSFNDVAMMYSGRHRVSVYDWTAVQSNVVGEFSQGDARDGYVYVPEQEVGYPKFTTVDGTRISLRHGVWNGAGYDNSRVKFINVPVLKSHGALGVTASLKHFMGVQDRWKNTDYAPHGPMQTEGFMGKMMLLARYPDLNIVDAIWVCPGASGPSAPYSAAVRLDRLVASQDPIALDYYCGKYVLWPVSGWGRHDPNCTNIENPGANHSYSDGTPCSGFDYNAFHQMLLSTYNVLAAAGKQVTMDESRMNIYQGVPPEPPPETLYEYFLAEGSTGYGFETWVLVANPNDQPATVRITYLTADGPRNREPLLVPANSRLTVNANADIWQQDSGVRVGSDLPVYVERAMYWSDRIEGHDSIGTDAGATEWYLAEGCTDYGFETWVEILNPGTSGATATLTYMTSRGPVAGPTVDVPAWSRKTVEVKRDIPADDVSVRVVSDLPVVVERSMYWDGRRGGHGSIGAKAPSQDWYLAEGATHSGFETYVLVSNPGEQQANVSLELVTTSGSGAGPVSADLVVPAGSRRTVRLNDITPYADVSTKLHSDVPVVAERSMFWPVAGGRAGHDSIGVTAPAQETFLPEGCTGYGFETWLLVQNPGEDEAIVSVYVMMEGGESRVAEFSLGAAERRTLRMNDFYTGNMSIHVRSSRPVASERAVYWNNRSGGTCSIGYSK